MRRAERGVGGWGGGIRRRNRELFANLCVYVREREPRTRRDGEGKKQGLCCSQRVKKQEVERERKRDRGREGSQTEGDTTEKERERKHKREKEKTRIEGSYTIYNTQSVRLCAYLLLTLFWSHIFKALCVSYITCFPSRNSSRNLFLKNYIFKMRKGLEFLPFAQFLLT